MIHYLLLAIATLKILEIPRCVKVSLKATAIVQGNVHKGRPIFERDVWSGKKGQNGTNKVGWLTKQRCRIIQPMICETKHLNISVLKVFSVNFEYDSY